MSNTLTGWLTFLDVLLERVPDLFGVLALESVTLVPTGYFRVMFDGPVLVVFQHRKEGSDGRVALELVATHVEVVELRLNSK